MPNHCFNEVKAKKEILDEIYDYADSILKTCEKNKANINFKRF